jgi:hypothetical protein
MRRTRYALLLGAATALSAKGVAAQTRPAGLDSATAAAIAPIIQRAQAANLPVDLLYDKAREGQVQRVPTARIEAAVKAVAERIHVANEALAPNATQEELRAATMALREGVPAETLRHMRQEGKNTSLAVPIGVLTSLIARGVPVEKASVKVVDLIRRGAGTEHFIALDTRVHEDVLAGKRPDESLDLRLKGILPNLPQQVQADGAAIQATTPNKKRP